ncbi:sugar phosphate nucleotidyltransferase [Candidatus Pollutiaquabacter sp.]|uniref:sugar phosphate nucleotidyltransferase n=1 Tax=Candidatus Pollutiaquabacter sp. TaxID=3416354 RepID=UPI003D0AFC77
MKVLIPVAGIGSKLRPHTHTQPKALVPVAGKPILSHIVDNLIEAGMREFIFIVGYLGDKVEEYIHSNYPGIIKHFIIQEPREGTGHAVWLARHLVNPGDELVIALGDTIFDVNLREVLSSETSALAVKRVDDPRTFGVAELDEDGFIRHVRRNRLSRNPTWHWSGCTRSGSRRNSSRHSTRSSTATSGRRVNII